MGSLSEENTVNEVTFDCFVFSEGIEFVDVAVFTLSENYFVGVTLCRS